MLAHGYQNTLSHLLDRYAWWPFWIYQRGWGHISSFAEFFGGLLILAGLFTRLAASAVCIDLAVAHWHNGLMGDRRYEFPLAPDALAFALIFFGGGATAIDHVFRGGSSLSSR